MIANPKEEALNHFASIKDSNLLENFLFGGGTSLPQNPTIPGSRVDGRDFGECVSSYLEEEEEGKNKNKKLLSSVCVRLEFHNKTHVLEI